MYNYKNKIEKWAYKFLADEYRNVVITKENLVKCFNGCIRLPKEHMYNDIIKKINELLSKGVKFNCEE